FNHFRGQTMRHDQLLRKLNSDSTPAAITEKRCERGKFQMNAENSPHKPEENQRPVRPMNVKGIRSPRVSLLSRFIQARLRRVDSVSAAFSGFSSLQNHFIRIFQTTTCSRRPIQCRRIPAPEI